MKLRVVVSVPQVDGSTLIDRVTIDGAETYDRAGRDAKAIAARDEWGRRFMAESGMQHDEYAIERECRVVKIERVEG